MVVDGILESIMGALIVISLIMPFSLVGLRKTRLLAIGLLGSLINILLVVTAIWNVQLTHQITALIFGIIVQVLEIFMTGSYMLNKK